MRRVAGVLIAALLMLPGLIEAQAPTGQPSLSTEVILRPGDALLITVWPNTDLGGQFPIEETGMVYLPYLGSVRAAGVPIQDLRDRLREGYATAVQNPVVTVTPLFQVSILGEVRVPGNYTASPTNNFFDVLGMAGGFTAASDLEKVRLVRAGQVVELDALRAIETGSGLEGLTLNSGDQLIVPARGGINWRTVLTVFQSLLTLGLLAERLVRN